MRCLGLLLFGGLAVAAAPAAWAQSATPSLANPGGPVVGTAAPPPGAAPPPPGVPGAASSNNPAPTTPPPAYGAMAPNDALFDAINRGDIDEARDAISRGAQLDARNVLGMTPLELAVDLNRNDIAFLLLSIEHEHAAAAAGTNSALSLSVPPVPAAMPGSSGQQGLGDGSVADILLANQPKASAPVAGAPVATRAALTPDPPSMAGTGSPDPAVGFLGFGPGVGRPPQN